MPSGAVSIASASALRFALPPSLGAQAQERAHLLERYFSEALVRSTEVRVAESYESLSRDLLSGRVQAAWAPPFVCARLEAMGTRVLLRGVRAGASAYRAALLCRASEPLTLEKLWGRSAAWSDRDSVGGYLLATSYLRSKGLDPAKVFFAQSFVGSYSAAATAVAEKRADVTSIFAPVSSVGGSGSTNLEEVAPNLVGALVPFAFTEETPNDGVAVAISAPALLVAALEKLLLELPQSPEGAKLIKEVFGADCFEPAPRMSYRALYRVALASL